MSHDLTKRLSDLSDQLDRTRRTLEANVKSAKSLRINVMHLSIASLLDISDSILVLMRNGKVSGLFNLLRVLLLHHADVINLINDEDYVDQLEYQFLEDSRKMVDAALNTSNPYLKDVRESYTQENLDWIICRQESLKAKLESKGKRSYPTDEYRLKLAGLKNQHQTLYSMFSSETHSTLHSLVSRFTVNDGQTSFHVPRVKLTEVDYDPIESHLLVLWTEIVERFVAFSKTETYQASIQAIDP